MAKIITPDGQNRHVEKKKHESTQMKQFETFEEVLDYLYALNPKPKKITIWPYMTAWTLSINYTK